MKESLHDLVSVYVCVCVCVCVCVRVKESLHDLVSVCVCVCMCYRSVTSHSLTPWTVARQAPLSLESLP